MAKVGVIVGSTRPGRLGKPIAEWVLEQAKNQSAAEFELVDLAEVNLPFLNETSVPAMGKYEHEHTKNWAKTIGQYDGFILVTPEYNHGYPATLKNALDTIFAEWNNKPVGFVGYGVVGGVRAIQQLKQVVLQLRMNPIHDDVNLVNPYGDFNADGYQAPEASNQALAKVINHVAAAASSKVLAAARS